MKIKGKYHIQKGNNKIQTNNKLTIFGALQLARYFKRNIVFPKHNKSFGCLLSYDGEYGKISVKDGASITNFNGGVSVSGSNLNTAYTYDDDLNTYTIYNFTRSDNVQTFSFDLKFKNSINIGKIGIMAKSHDVYDRNNEQSQSFNGLNDWTMFFKPQGVKITFEEKDLTNDSTIENICSLFSGNYIRVYNANYPLHNNKPYYIMNKYIKLGDNSYSRIFCCLFYNKNNWTIKKISLDNTYNGDTDFDTVSSKYCISKSDIQNLDSIVDTNFNGTNSAFQWVKTLTNMNENNFVFQFKNQYLSQNFTEKWQIYDNPNLYYCEVTLTNSIEPWLKPCYTLHTYLNDFYSNDAVLQTYDKWRWMQLIPDNYTRYTGNGNTYLNYNNRNNNFNPYACYNVYSFESLQGFNALYNLSSKYDKLSVDFCNEHMVGFIPYISEIRFYKKTAHTTYYKQSSLDIFGIDIFEKHSTPYNPIKIALTQTNDFNNANSWFVDTIERKGNNTIVFTKTLNTQDGITTSTGFKKIGLFGNLDGHLIGTLPKDIIIKKTNCFSSANFANPWTKTNQQTVIITYELTIGEEE